MTMPENSSWLTEADRALNRGIESDKVELKNGRSVQVLRSNPWIALGRFAFAFALVAGLILAWSV